MPSNTLRHLAIIMDGNGRWASLKGKPRSFGHIQGVKVAKEIVSYVAKTDISYLTLFAFSAENTLRSKIELDHLTSLFRKALATQSSLLEEHDIRLSVLGDLNFFSEDVRDMFNNLVEKTKSNKKLNVILALNYGGQQEIVEGVKNIIKESQSKPINPQTLNKDIFNSFLPSCTFPNPDLIIRTGGFNRLSNFYLWSAAYSEIAFIDVLWPDFNVRMIKEEIDKFSAIKRNFGMISHEGLE